MTTDSTHPTPPKGISFAVAHDPNNDFALAAAFLKGNISEAGIGRSLHLDGTFVASHVDVGRDRG